MTYVQESGQLGMEVKHRWWQEEKEQPAKSIFSLMRYWDSTQNHIMRANMMHLRLYQNRQVSTLGIANWVLSQTVDNSNTASGLAGAWNRPFRLSFNICKSATDTLVSKMAKNKIKPTAMTSGGILEQRQRAQRLNKFLFGCFTEGGAYKEGNLTLKNACIFGTAAMKIIVDGETIRYENVFPDEIVVDPADGYYGNPRMLYQRKFVSRESVIREFPDKEDLIRTAPAVQGYQVGISDDIILIVEAWRRATKEDEGRRILCVENCVLVDEPYRKKNFPFAFLRYTKQPVGFWGTGLIEQGVGVQLEINRLLFHAQETMRLMSYPRWLVERGSKINKAHFINDIGTVIEFTGTPPAMQVQNSVPPEVLNQIEQLKMSFYNEIGISQLSAQSQKPAGLNSGKALREFSDIESDRFTEFGQAWEQFYIDLAYVTIEAVDDIGDDFTVSVATKDNGLEKLTWGEVKLPMDNYLWQCFPTSKFPQNPAARLQYVQEMLQGGFIDPQLAIDLLDFPDVDAAMSVQLAPSRLIMKLLEKAIFEGKYNSPEPFMPLDLAIKWGNSYYCWGVLNEIPEDRLELVRDFIEACNVLVQRAQEKAAAKSQQPIAPLQASQAAQLAAPVNAQVSPEMMFGTMA